MDTILIALYISIGSAFAIAEVLDHGINRPIDNILVIIVFICSLPLWPAIKLYQFLDENF